MKIAMSWLSGYGEFLTFSRKGINTLYILFMIAVREQLGGENGSLKKTKVLTSMKAN